MLLIILLVAEITFCAVSKQFSPLPRNDQLNPLPIRRTMTKILPQNLINEDKCIWSIKNSYLKTDLDQKTSNKIEDALKSTCNGEIAIHLEDNTHSESLVIKDYLSKTEVSIEGFNTLGVVIGQTEWNRDIENDFILTIDESSTISLRLKNIIFIGAGVVKLDGDSWVLIEQSSFQLPITTRNDVVGSQYPFISAAKGVLEVKQCSFGTDEGTTNIGSPAISVKSGCIKFICSISSFSNLLSGAIDLEVGISSTAQIEESKFNKCGSEVALSGGVYVIGQYNEDEEDCDDEDAPPPPVDQPGSEPGYPGQEGYGQINNEQSNININIDHQNKTKKNKCKGDGETEPSVDPPGPLPHPRTGIKKYKSQYKHQIKSKSDTPVVYPCDQPIHGYPEQHQPDDGQGSEGSDCYYYDDDYIYDRDIGKVSIKGNQFYECYGRIAGGILFGERVLPISATGNHFFQNTALDAEGAKDIIFQSKVLLDRAGGIEIVASGYVQVQQQDQTYEGQVKISGYNSNFAQYLNCKTESKEEVDCKEIPEGGQVVIPMYPQPEEGEDIAIGIGIDDGHYDRKDISDDDSGNQLGIGVIVGIIVGCVAVVAVVAVIIVLVVQFKSKKSSTTGIQQSTGNEVQISKE